MTDLDPAFVGGLVRRERPVQAGLASFGLAACWPQFERLHDELVGSIERTGVAVRVPLVGDGVDGRSSDDGVPR